MRKVKKEIILSDLVDSIIVKKLKHVSNKIDKNILMIVCTIEDNHLGIVEVKANYWISNKKTPYSVSLNIIDSKTQITIMDDEVVRVEDNTFSSKIFKSYISEEMKEKIRSIASKMQNT